jgi:hypothetical protein
MKTSFFYVLDYFSIVIENCFENFFVRSCNFNVDANDCFDSSKSLLHVLFQSPISH